MLGGAIVVILLDDRGAQVAGFDPCSAHYRGRPDQVIVAALSPGSTFTLAGKPDEQKTLAQRPGQSVQSRSRPDESWTLRGKPQPPSDVLIGRADQTITLASSVDPGTVTIPGKPDVSQTPAGKPDEAQTLQVRPQETLTQALKPDEC